MSWDVTPTVLTSVFGFTLLAFFLYGICYRLVPHLRQPKTRPDFTLPQTERPVNRELRTSLYSRPSINYIDPRNSIADTELVSSRWSTSINDLDPPPCPASPAPSGSPSLPRSPCMHFNSRASITSPTRLEARATSPKSIRSQREQKSLRKMQSANTMGHKRQAKSYPPEHPQVSPAEKKRPPRLRSKSEAALKIYPRLLERSHAALYSRSIQDVLQSPTTSDFSGITLVPSPRTPQRPTLRTAVSTSKVRSPSHRHGLPRTRMFDFQPAKCNTGD